MASDLVSKAKRDLHKFLPSTAHEVDATLMIEFGSAGQEEFQHSSHCIESPERTATALPQVIVRLGTKVDDEVPSHVGFRIFLRKCAALDPNISGVLEEHYVIVSFRLFTPGSEIIHVPMTLEKKHEATGNCTRLGAFDPKIQPKEEDRAKEKVHGMVILQTFLGPFCDISSFRENDVSLTKEVMQVLALIKQFQFAKCVRLYFPWDSVLFSRLQQAIDNDYKGHKALSWKTPLPENSLRTWPHNNQTQMVRGSTAILNVMTKLNHQPLLYDGPGTSLDSRPLARRFKTFIYTQYPILKQETVDKLYPIFLHVQGLCIEFPFGASMINRENTYAGINTLHKLLAMGFEASSIGIVAFYPAQVEAYKDGLRQCHTVRTGAGYDKITADVLENWVDQDIGIAIVDFVRTANASGNLGFLSQLRRLQASMSLHRDGLVVIGDRRCTLAADDSILSTKLEKVLQWFDENGRIVQVSDKGSPLSFDMPKQPTKDPPTPPHLRCPQNTPPKPRYTGIPELDRNIGKSPVLSKLEHPKASALDSFTRQKRVLALEENIRPAITSLKQELYGNKSALKVAEAGAQGPLIDFSSDTENLSTTLNPKLRSQFQTAFAPPQDRSSSEAPKSTLISDWKKRVLESSLSQVIPLKFDQQIKTEESLTQTPPTKEGEAIPYLSDKFENSKPLIPSSFDPESGNTNKDKIGVSFSPTTPRVIPSGTTPTLSPDKTSALAPKAANAYLPQKSSTITSTTFDDTIPLGLTSYGVSVRQQPPAPTVEQSRQYTTAPPFDQRYLAKYHALRALFSTIHDTTVPSPAEDQLFRRLADAYITADANTFDLVYAELLRMVAGLQFA